MPHPRPYNSNGLAKEHRLSPRLLFVSAQAVRSTQPYYPSRYVCALSAPLVHLSPISDRHQITSHSSLSISPSQLLLVAPPVTKSLVSQPRSFYDGQSLRVHTIRVVRK